MNVSEKQVNKYCMHEFFMDLYKISNKWTRPEGKKNEKCSAKAHYSANNIKLQYYTIIYGYHTKNSIDY